LEEQNQAKLAGLKYSDPSKVDLGKLNLEVSPAVRAKFQTSKFLINI